MNKTHTYLELDGTEFKIEFEYFYYYQAAQLYGEPGDCSPEEEEFEYNILTTDEGMNAIESYLLMEWRCVSEVLFFDAAMRDIFMRVTGEREG